MVRMILSNSFIVLLSIVMAVHCTIKKFGFEGLNELESDVCEVGVEDCFRC